MMDKLDAKIAEVNAVVDRAMNSRRCPNCQQFGLPAGYPGCFQCVNGACPVNNFGDGWLGVKS